MSLLIIVLISSCIMDEPATNPGTGILVTVAPADFDWNMIKTVTLQLTGMPTEVPVYNTLKVSDKAGIVYLNKWVLMSENDTLSISIPAKTDTIVVSYGALSKKLKVVDGLMVVDYVTPHPDPETPAELEAAAN